MQGRPAGGSEPYKPRSVEDYVERWTNAQSLIAIGHPLDMQLPPESCIMSEVIRDSIGSSSVSVTDLGDAACWFLYFRMGEDLDTGQPPSEKLLAGQAAARAALTVLLERYCRDGYDPSMNAALMQAVGGNLRNFSLDCVYMLPGDLKAVHDGYGIPLADYAAYDTEAEAAAHTPSFDLNNPAHREALLKRTYATAQ